MSNLVIVAIPRQDERVWKVSSEKVPHLTLLHLGDVDSNPNLDRIMQFVEHVITVSEHGPFMLSVEYRGTLGDSGADVLFFQKDWDIKWIDQFRSQLLQNGTIRQAFESSEQFMRDGGDGGPDQYQEWIPHLTLGYPETPAKESEEDESRLHWITFDRIAVWTEDYDGPSWRLKWPDRDQEMAVGWSDQEEGVKTEIRAPEKPSLEDALEHYGVKGMKWGVRKPPPTPVATRATTVVPHGAKRKTKIKVEGGENHDATEDAIKVAQTKAKLIKSGPAALSNKELQELQTRMNLEKNVSELVKQQTVLGKGRKFVRNITGLNRELNESVGTGLQTQRLANQLR